MRRMSKIYCSLITALLLILAGCSSSSTDEDPSGLDTGVSDADADRGDASGDTSALDTGSDTEPDTAGARDTGADTDTDANDAADGGEQDRAPWVTAYLASWKHYAPPGGNWGNLPTDEIDWDAFTHLNYFAMRVHSDGSLGPIEQNQNMNADRINAIVDAAHDHDKPVLFSIGGATNHDGFADAIAPDVRQTFIDNLIDLLNEWEFDGIDVDMEPIYSEDYPDYKAFITELHAALQDESTPMRSTPIMTAAVQRQADLFVELKDYFDQINLMTYDFSGAWQGWVTWHNSPLSNGGYTFESTGEEVPSVEREVDRYLDAGMPPEKIGIGIDFYGYVWSGGVWEPRQSWDDPPEVEGNVPYHDIMSDYFQEDYYRWDDQALSPYLAIEDQDPQQFVSYDDERAIREKLDYVRREGLGGAIVWEIGGGYREDQPDGQRDPLLQAVKEGMQADSTTP